VHEGIGEPHHQSPSSLAGWSAVVHERSYEEVRELVLLLAAQPIGRDVAEDLQTMVVHADHGWPEIPSRIAGPACR